MVHLNRTDQMASYILTVEIEESSIVANKYIFSGRRVLRAGPRQCIFIWRIFFSLLSHFARPNYRSLDLP